MIFNIYNFRTMTTKTTQTVAKRRHCRRVLLGVAVLATFAMFAACERPEPEPEPPSAPVVDTDTLPANKFVGTWVLCAMNDVNSEPPATCDLANATSDTLVFVDDKRLTHRHGETIFEYWYECSEHFLIRYRYSDTTYISAGTLKYYFRENNEELVLCGNLMPVGNKNFGFRRITQD